MLSELLDLRSSWTWGPVGRRVLGVCTSRVVGTLMKNRGRGPEERKIWGLEGNSASRWEAQSRRLYFLLWLRAGSALRLWETGT